MATRKSTVVPGSRRRGAAAASENTDEWTDATTPAPTEEVEVEPTQKLSMEFPLSAHRALKGGAGFAGTTMVTALVEMVRARYLGARWPDDVVEQVKAQIGYQEPPSEEAESATAVADSAPKKRVSRARRGA